ncbi:cytochrome P450 [Irpex rosettiformis]|uniref:Cytochrome P450 n=1 Tax=Irpex rosettiformis TaxID=378272 RepID=A0ACB8UFG7_9APHY|nr:cytochrome P450 [Irpex rosettiformis]
MTTPIPVPPYVPLLTHAVQIDTDTPVKTFKAWFDTYGDIFKIYLFNKTSIWVSSAALCAELSNDQKFSKSIGGALVEIRALVDDGLFTAWKEEPNWGIAHRLLTPSFKMTEVKSMFPDMMDIATQLILKWERFGPDYRLNPTEDFTRLTLDTITLCSMSFRLNSFYRDDNHPFVQAMYDFLTECGRRIRRPAISDYVFPANYNKWQGDITYMNNLAQSILDKRRQRPIDKQDLLNVMLNNKDPKTGKNMTDESIINNLITFLIAGHETTSGLLSFCVYYLIKNPETMRKAQAEVDDVLSDQQLQPEDLSKFPYLTATLRETLRLGPTIAVRQVEANEDTTIGNGKYFIKKGQRVVIHLAGVHRDKAVWGEDADEFKPERMLDGKFEALPLGAWQPFGFGSRVCIGRPFAMQEATMALAMILQKFTFELADPDYELEIMQTLTVKPKNFFIHAIPRGEVYTTA